MIAESLGQDAITTSKHVKVLPTLQLPSQQSIFALGDIIDWKEQKQAVKAGFHASIIATNILSLLSGSKPQKQYKTGPEMILVTNGRVNFYAFNMRVHTTDPHTEWWCYVRWRNVGYDSR